MEPTVSGDLYYDVLNELHIKRKPARYLEVGTFAGDSLVLSRCASIARDPSMALSESNLKRIKTNIPELHMMEMSSDDFSKPTIPKNC